MSRTPIIAGNWKLHMNPEQTKKIKEELETLENKLKKLEV